MMEIKKSKKCRLGFFKKGCRYRWACKDCSEFKQNLWRETFKMKEKEFNLSEKRVYGKPLYWYAEYLVKEFIRICGDEQYFDEVNNCWVIKCEDIKKLAGDKLI